MKTSDTTQQVIIYQCTPNQAWYSNLIPLQLTVTPSGDKTEWYIADGIYEGRHVAKADCTPLMMEVSA